MLYVMFSKFEVSAQIFLACQTQSSGVSQLVRSSQNQASEFEFLTGKTGNVSTWIPSRCFPFPGNTHYSYYTQTHCLILVRITTFASAAASSAAAFSAAAFSVYSAAALASASAFAFTSAAVFASASV